MDGAGLSQPQPSPPPPPPPPPPRDQKQPPQIDPADPPQQQDNVERKMQDWLTRDEQLGYLYIKLWGSISFAEWKCNVLRICRKKLGENGCQELVE
ncbi:hypothetical protein Syun_018822 [Stephania yunnanensis]|uniref:Uncharacterized protein n=1 Tax=Stephania yunnanensis TaxID=152371 RepID=A0AAP0ITL8_9MAGN